MNVILTYVLIALRHDFIPRYKHTTAATLTQNQKPTLRKHKLSHERIHQTLNRTFIFVLQEKSDETKI